MDIFEKLEPGEITIQLYMNLQNAYNEALKTGREMPKIWLSSYKKRVRLRLKILLDFIAENSLIFSPELIKKALPDLNPELLKETLKEINGTKSLEEKKPAPAPAEKIIVLMNGGPGTGKSSLLPEEKNILPKNGIILKRDEIFKKLPPYKRLQKEHPDEATHAVVTEAIFYNERDAYRYAVLAGTPIVIVDGTMSYTDLGIEMIKFGQKAGYKVGVINMDCKLETAIARSKKRAEKTGKTINEKLLYESHVRSSTNFFKYIKLADFTENWNNDEKEPYQYGRALRISLAEAEESTYMVNRKICKYKKIMREGGMVKVGHEAIKIIPAGEDEVIVQMIRYIPAYEQLKEKSIMKLENVSWPPDYDTYLQESKNHMDILERFLP